MRKYVIMGVQGSGKGTQSQLLASDLAIVHISVGDMFREHVARHTQLGEQVQRLLAAGELVPDETTQEMIAGRLAEHDWNYGFVIDGFPRNAGQARFFLANYDADAVIHLDLPDSEVWARVEQRRKAAQGDSGGGPEPADSSPRDDDTAEALAVRIREYHANAEPVLDEFRRKGEYVITVDARPEPDAVQQDIRSKLGLPPYKAN